VYQFTGMYTSVIRALGKAAVMYLKPSNLAVMADRSNCHTRHQIHCNKKSVSDCQLKKKQHSNTFKKFKIKKANSSAQETLLRATKRHLSYDFAQCYLQPDTARQAGTQFTYYYYY